MSDTFSFQCEVRSGEGKGASRRLCRQAKIPAILYGGKAEPQSLALAENQVMRAIGFESFFASIVELEVNGRKVSAIIKDLQRHPYKNRVLHMDFMRVSKNTEIHVHVPLHFINEDKCVGARAGGTIHHAAVELHIVCLPADLPEFIEVDIAGLEIGQSLHISDLLLPAGVTSIDLAQGEEHDLSLVSIAAPRGGDLSGDKVEAESDSGNDSEE